MDELLMNASMIGVRVEERRLPSGLCGVYYEPARSLSWMSRCRTSNDGARSATNSSTPNTTTPDAAVGMG